VLEDSQKNELNRHQIILFAKFKNDIQKKNVSFFTSFFVNNRDMETRSTFKFHCEKPNFHNVILTVCLLYVISSSMIFLEKKEKFYKLEDDMNFYRSYILI